MSGERFKVVCPTCDGTGWSAIGNLASGGMCGDCRGDGAVWPERRAAILLRGRA